MTVIAPLACHETNNYDWATDGCQLVQSNFFSIRPCDIMFSLAFSMAWFANSHCNDWPMQKARFSFIGLMKFC